MQEFAGNFLTYLERREEKLLSWGFYEVNYSESELLQALSTEAPPELADQWQFLHKKGITFKGFLNELRQSNLLFRVPDSPTMYRTRMGEGIRLLANLRQFFAPQDWASGPRLISDLKIHLRDRIYPRRDLHPHGVWEKALKGLCPPDSERLLRESYDSLLKDASGNDYLLSGFQQRSFENIFREYCAGNGTGTVICAGTGAGKTKAFYVPAFLRVIMEIKANPAPFTKVIAIYPRNVLLADQFREALAESIKLLPVLQHNKLRPITFGALLGLAPYEGWFTSVSEGRKRPSWFWEERTDGHVIPYLVSPKDGRSDLIWRSQDRKLGQTPLYRSGNRVPDIPDGILRITREQLMRDPPDILFLSLEMLNRELGNPQWRKTFGIAQGKTAPRLVLLDEVHTYEGVQGAQAAWVLRRWKYWVFSTGNSSVPHFVGLSATLKEAPEHMGRVSGVPTHQVTEISPVPGANSTGEEVAEGQEYNLAIKGDPSSGTALLSTSIQSAMLLTRLLTPRTYVLSEPLPVIRSDIYYPPRVFGFTDNLDSLNRWYSSMRDAERQHLARLRTVPSPLPDQLTMSRMRREGQLWELPVRLGHDLAQSLDVSRCSSQDPGANAGSDLILATSSLEVGFDDPRVGIILHHKSPASMASFVQRKGRAGRIRGSRPWTVAVLSDYGRDRWMFQTAERLFSPEIDRISLPVTNPYVLRIQMGLFAIDWLGQKIGLANSPFSYLSKRSDWILAKRAQERAKAYLNDFLTQGEQWDLFFQGAYRMYFYGRGGLSWNSEEDREIAATELNSIFWDEPRPLLTEGFAALLRKLEVDWKQSGPSNRSDEDLGAGRPMPQFIPKATFEELDLNEARLELESFGDYKKDNELLPLPSFLRESCPGRVSKRYSTLAANNVPEPGYWQHYSEKLHQGQNVVDMGDIYPAHVSLGIFGNIRVYSPLSSSIVHITPDILESSSGEWEWQTVASIFNAGSGENLPFEHCAPWKEVFSQVSGHLHCNGSWIGLVRFANNSRFDIRRPDGGSIQGTLCFQHDDGGQEAVGFQVNADGIRFGIKYDHLRSLPGITLESLEHLRYAFFLDQILKSQVLSARLNSFQAEWMAQVSISMLCSTALINRTSLHDAQILLQNRRTEAALKVLEIIFQVRGVGPNGGEEEPRLKREIVNLWKNTSVVKEIERLETHLWAPLPQPEFDKWLEERHLATLVQAIRAAMASISDQVNIDDLVVDVTAIDGRRTLLVTEKNSGGLGLIESLVYEIKSDPRLFFDAVEYAISYCPRDSWALNLRAVINQAIKDYENSPGGFVTAFSEVRNASSVTSLELAKRKLITSLQGHGLSSQRADISAICMKILKPGSSKDTDILTYLVNKAWIKHSKKLGLDIPIRTFAYVLSHYVPCQQRIMRLFKRIYGATPAKSQLYAVIQQLLYDRCNDSCPDCLNNPNIYNNFAKPAREISQLWLGLGTTEVLIDSDIKNWSTRARDVLRTKGRVCLVSSILESGILLEGLGPLFFEEINVGDLRESAYINRLDRLGGDIRVTLQIRNFLNAQP